MVGLLTGGASELLRFRDTTDLSECDDWLNSGMETAAGPLVSTG